MLTYLCDVLSEIRGSGGILGVRKLLGVRNLLGSRDGLRAVSDRVLRRGRQRRVRLLKLILIISQLGIVYLKHRRVFSFGEQRSGIGEEDLHGRGFGILEIDQIVPFSRVQQQLCPTIQLLGIHARLLR